MFTKVPKGTARAELTYADVQPVYPDSVANSGVGEGAAYTSESDR